MVFNIGLSGSNPETSNPFFSKLYSISWRIQWNRITVEWGAQNANFSAVYARAPNFSPEMSPVRIEDSEFGELTISLFSE